MRMSPVVRFIFILAVAAATLFPIMAFAQSAPDGWMVLRTADGRPDLQGVWANNNTTPLQRPEAWAGKERLNSEELAELKIAAQHAVDDGDALFGDQLVLAAIERTQATSYDPTTGNYNQFWVADRTFNTDRTSLVVDPPNGRIPGRTPASQASRRELEVRRDEHPADSYSDRPLPERCVTYGVPRIESGYNSYIQIFQGKDHVVVYQEMIHDARVVPIGDRPHLNESIRQLHGDSRGHWQGDTLVIETTNYLTGARPYQGTGKDLHVTERFTRVSDEILNYEVTFSDPGNWTERWTVSIPLRYSQEPVFEYACHEGNIGMEGILSGHRAQERAEIARAAR